MYSPIYYTAHIVVANCPKRLLIIYITISSPTSSFSFFFFSFFSSLPVPRTRPLLQPLITPTPPASLRRRLSRLHAYHPSRTYLPPVTRLGSLQTLCTTSIPLTSLGSYLAILPANSPLNTLATKGHFELFELFHFFSLHVQFPAL